MLNFSRVEAFRGSSIEISLIRRRLLFSTPAPDVPVNKVAAESCNWNPGCWFQADFTCGQRDGQTDRDDAIW
jgi:hypothetical protein